jgi:hypothetical protein
MSTTATAPKAKSELDVAFCCDCTGSMSAYLKSAQDNIYKISQEINTRAQNCDVRFALIKYRDHPPQDSTFVTEVYPFTDCIEVMKSNIDTMRAQGGGDGPEAVSAALHEVNELDWRANATKVCVFIADAPPHGLGEDGDGFPNGCPLGTDPIVSCKAMAAKGITVYAVGVEPVLSTQYKYARDFMMMVAKVTEGKFLPLGRADILSTVIVNGALEGLNMQELWDNMEKEAKEEAEKAGKKLSEAELVSATEARLAGCKKEVAQVSVENPYERDYDMANCAFMEGATSLASARQQLKPTLNAHAKEVSAGYAWSAQPAMCSSAPMMAEQACRKTAHVKKAKGMF